MSKTAYYLLPSVRVEAFRAHAGAYIVGVPQPTAVAGLAYALGLAISRKTGKSLAQAPGVAYGVREWSGFAGISLNPRQASNTDAAKRSTPAAIDDRVRASVTLTLLLELVFEGDEAPEASLVSQVVEQLRLQSGSLFCQAPARQFDALPEVAPYLPRDAFFLWDASADMREALGTQPVTWKALLSFIERPRDKDEYKPRWVPALVGWRPLHEPAPRRGMREGAIAHAMAEPAIGLARFCSAASFKRELKALDDADHPVFWKHAVDIAGQPHYVVQGFAPFIADFEF